MPILSKAPPVACTNAMSALPLLETAGDSIYAPPGLSNGKRTWYGVIVLNDFSAIHHPPATARGNATATAPAAASCFPLSERT